MKIKRLCATNIRDAMRKVREELGPDAVILSNERAGAGFEIVAAVDYDEKLLQGMAPPAAASITASGAASNARVPRKNGGSDSHPDARDGNPPTPPAAPASGDKPRVVWSQDPLLVEMRQEIRLMHDLLEQQLSSLAWGELARRQPCRARLLGQLMDFGLDPDLCLRLADAAARESDPGQAWRLALETLGRGLSVTQDDILTQGGVVALIGPTGVGKTTTVAKLAARYNLRHGPHRVALITTDGYRIGAFDQLCTFGMIMDTPVKLVGTAEELLDTLATFSSRSLILIDTAGMSQRDLRLSQQFALLNGTPRIRSYLVLAANTQHAVLRETVEAFARVPLSGAIVTKIDETTRLGAALSVVHEKRLPLAYVSNGQRVPEDLQVARIDALLRIGEEFAGPRDHDAANDALALTFGGRLASHAVL